VGSCWGVSAGSLSPLGAAVRVSWDLWLPAAGNAERGGGGLGVELPFPCGWEGGGELARRWAARPASRQSFTQGRTLRGKTSWPNFVSKAACRARKRHGTLRGAVFTQQRQQNCGKMAGAPEREPCQGPCLCGEDNRSGLGREGAFLRRSSSLAVCLLVLQKKGGTEGKRRMPFFA